MLPQGILSTALVLLCVAMKQEYRYWVYIVASTTGTLYTGMTGDLYTRIMQHKAGEIEGFSKTYSCDRLVHYAGTNEVIAMINREKQIKSWRRKKKIDISLDDETLPATEMIMAGKHPRSDPDTDIAIRKLLAELPPKHQSVLRLHDIEGYRHQDISRLLGITAGASRSQLHKIRIKLRIALGLNHTQKPRPARLECVKLKLAEAA
jgi:RNA polymerase sigma factor (sigma-70 family)